MCVVYYVLQVRMTSSYNWYTINCIVYEVFKTLIVVTQRTRSASDVSIYIILNI